MKECDMYPATRGNQITAEYYFTLVEQINAGTSNKRVCRILRTNGSYKYFTYHLISVSG